MSTAALPSQLFIDGAWCDAAAGATLDVLDPSDESVLQTITYGSADDLRRAIDAAARAFPAWRDRTPYDRGAILLRAAELTRGSRERLATLLSREEGKTLAGALAEVEQTAATLEWFAEEGKRAYGRIVPSRSAGKRLWVLRQPVGVCAAITPWNFPLMLQARKIGAALAAGCTTLSRPASQTPLATMAWFECLQAAGFPPGTINLVTGPPRPLVAALMDDPRVAKLSFTGSVEVGQELMQLAAPRLKKLELELGGHAPVLVFPDVDIAAAARACAVGKFRNMGQVCISPSRFYVHESVKADFTEALLAAVATFRLGPPLDPACEAGPLFEARLVEQAERFVADAVAKGARVLCGGRRPPQFTRGYWYEPTVLDGVTPAMACTCEEVFGPVMPLLSFTDTDAVLAAANATPYALAAFVMTRDLSTALRCAEGLEAGIVGVNDTVPSCPEAPFGGMKSSGLGRECGSEGLNEYLETKFVSVAL